RRRLGEQIALARRRARAAAGGAASGPVPAEDPADVVISVEQVRAPLRASLEDAIPMLADCFPPPGDDGGLRPPAVATMTLTSDPDFGTVIDTAQVTDADGHPLPAAIDTCLRDRIDSLALPPLGNGGKLPLQYSFRFDDDD
ncbi:MAG TPA: hypothetical protein VHE35_36040, partial [Kofleriaceae bacterium]|nr:hypothetical protein [Kofleriaceae bacterium]